MALFSRTEVGGLVGRDFLSSSAAVGVVLVAIVVAAAAAHP